MPKLLWGTEPGQLQLTSSAGANFQITSPTSLLIQTEQTNIFLGDAERASHKSPFKIEVEGQDPVPLNEEFFKQLPSKQDLEVSFQTNTTEEGKLESLPRPALEAKLKEYMGEDYQTFLEQNKLNEPNADWSPANLTTLTREYLFKIKLRQYLGDKTDDFFRHYSQHVLGSSISGIANTYLQQNFGISLGVNEATQAVVIKVNTAGAVSVVVGYQNIIIKLSRSKAINPVDFPDTFEFEVILESDGFHVSPIDPSTDSFGTIFSGTLSVTGLITAYPKLRPMVIEHIKGFVNKSGTGALLPDLTNSVYFPAESCAQLRILLNLSPAANPVTDNITAVVAEACTIKATKIPDTFSTFEIDLLLTIVNFCSTPPLPRGEAEQAIYEEKKKKFIEKITMLAQDPYINQPEASTITTTLTRAATRLGLPTAANTAMSVITANITRLINFPTLGLDITTLTATLPEVELRKLRFLFPKTGPAQATPDSLRAFLSDLQSYYPNAFLEATTRNKSLSAAQANAINNLQAALRENNNGALKITFSLLKTTKEAEFYFSPKVCQILRNKLQLEDGNNNINQVVYDAFNRQTPLTDKEKEAIAAIIAFCEADYSREQMPTTKMGASEEERTTLLNNAAKQYAAQQLNALSKSLNTHLGLENIFESTMKELSQYSALGLDTSSITATLPESELLKLRIIFPQIFSLRKSPDSLQAFLKDFSSTYPTAMQDVITNPRANFSNTQKNMLIALLRALRASRDNPGNAPLNMSSIRLPTQKIGDGPRNLDRNVAYVESNSSSIAMDSFNQLQSYEKEILIANYNNISSYFRLATCQDLRALFNLPKTDNYDNISKVLEDVAFNRKAPITDFERNLILVITSFCKLDSPTSADKKLFAQNVERLCTAVEVNKAHPVASTNFVNRINRSTLVNIKNTSRSFIESIQNYFSRVNQLYTLVWQYFFPPYESGDVINEAMAKARLYPGERGNQAANTKIADPEVKEKLKNDKIHSNAIYLASKLRLIVNRTPTNQDEDFSYSLLKLMVYITNNKDAFPLAKLNEVLTAAGLKNLSQDEIDTFQLNTPEKLTNYLMAYEVEKLLAEKKDHPEDAVLRNEAIRLEKSVGLPGITQTRIKLKELDTFTVDNLFTEMLKCQKLALKLSELESKEKQNIVVTEEIDDRGTTTYKVDIKAFEKSLKTLININDSTSALDLINAQAAIAIRLRSFDNNDPKDRGILFVYIKMSQIIDSKLDPSSSYTRRLLPQQKQAHTDSQMLRRTAEKLDENFDRSANTLSSTTSKKADQSSTPSASSASKPIDIDQTEITFTQRNFKKPS